MTETMYSSATCLLGDTSVTGQAGYAHASGTCASSSFSLLVIVVGGCLRMVDSTATLRQKVESLQLLSLRFSYTSTFDCAEG